MSSTTAPVIPLHHRRKPPSPLRKSHLPETEFPFTPPASPLDPAFSAEPSSPSNTRSEIIYQPSPPPSPGASTEHAFDKPNRSSFELPRDARQGRPGKARPQGIRRLSSSLGLNLESIKREEKEAVMMRASIDRRQSVAKLPGWLRLPRLRRTRVIAGVLLSAALVCAFLLFMSPQPDLPPPDSAPKTRPAPKWRRKTKAVNASPWSWPSPEVELAALMTFVFGAQHNHITYTDNKSLSPDLVLEFDPRSKDGAANLAEIASTAYLSHPVILLMDDTRHSRLTKAALDDVKAAKPEIVRVNQRTDSAALLVVLERLVGSQTLPLAIIGGSVVGSWDQVHALQQSGKLETLIREAKLGLTDPSQRALKPKPVDGEVIKQRKRKMEALIEDEEDNEKVLQAQLPVAGGIA